MSGASAMLTMTGGTDTAPATLPLETVTEMTFPLTELTPLPTMPPSEEAEPQADKNTSANATLRHRTFMATSESDRAVPTARRPFHPAAPSYALPRNNRPRERHAFAFHPPPADYDRDRETTAVGWRRGETSHPAAALRVATTRARRHRCCRRRLCAAATAPHRARCCA